MAISLLQAILLTSCINLNKFFKIDYNTAMLNIPASITQAEVQDSRSYVSPGEDISLPVFSWPGQFAEFYPALNPTHKRLVLDLIDKSFRANDLRTYKIHVALLEGAKEFSASFTKETETVKIKLRITLFNETEKYTVETSGKYFISSGDAKYKRFEELYQKALQAVTYAGLEELKSKYFSH